MLRRLLRISPAPDAEPGLLHVPGADEAALATEGGVAMLLDMTLLRAGLAMDPATLAVTFWLGCLERTTLVRGLDAKEQVTAARVAAVLPFYIRSHLELLEGEWGSAVATPTGPTVTLAHLTVVHWLLRLLRAEGLDAVARVLVPLTSDALADADFHRNLVAPILWELTGRVSGSLPPLSPAAHAAAHGAGVAPLRCRACDGLATDCGVCGDVDGVGGDGDGGRFLAANPAALLVHHHVGPATSAYAINRAVAEDMAAVTGAAPPAAAAAAARAAAATSVGVGAGYHARAVATLTLPDTFVPPLQLLEALLRAPGVLPALLSDAAYGWGVHLLPVTPQSAAALLAAPAAAAGRYVPPCDGVAVQASTFLGRLLSLGPRFRDLSSAAAAVASTAGSGGGGVGGAASLSLAAASSAVGSPGGVASIERLTDPFCCSCGDSEAASGGLVSMFLRAPLPGEPPPEVSAARRAATTGAGNRDGGDGGDGGGGDGMCDPLLPLILAEQSSTGGYGSGSAAGAGGVPALLARAFGVSAAPGSVGGSMAQTGPASAAQARDELRGRLDALRAAAAAYLVQAERVVRLITLHAEDLARFPPLPPALPLPASVNTATGKFSRGREALFAWAGLLLDANAARAQLAYTELHASPALAGVSHACLLFNATALLVRLCGGFIDPACPRAAQVDVRYLSRHMPNGAGGGPGGGGGRFHAAADDRLAPFQDDGDAAGGGGAGAGWLDVRNLARQEQFRQRQAAMQRSAAAAAIGGSLAAAAPLSRSATSGSGSGGSTASPVVTPMRTASAGDGGDFSLALASPAVAAPAAAVAPGPVAWSAITEFWGLAARGMHLSLASAATRCGKLLEHIHKVRGRVLEATDALLALPDGGRSPAAAGRGFAPAVHAHYPRLRHLLAQLAKLVEGYLSLFVHAGHTEALTGTFLPLARLTCVALTRAAVGDAEEFLARVAVPHASPLREGGGEAAAPASPSGFAPLPPPPARLLLPQLVRAALAAGLPQLPDVQPVHLLPLPPPSRALCALPEHLLGDACQLVAWTIGREVTAAAPVDAKAGNPSLFYDATQPAMHDLCTALVLFLASPLHAHNPYLRGRCARALERAYVLPRDNPARYLEDTSYWAARCPPRQRGVSYRRTPLHSILCAHPLAVAALGPALLCQHVDVAHSGHHAGFYMTFDERVCSADLLDYVWGVPAHREATLAWCRAPLPEGADSSYANGAKALKFASSVIGDVTHHTDEVLKALREIRDVERERQEAGWAALSAEQRADRDGVHASQTRAVRSWLFYTAGQLGLLSRLTEAGGGPSLAFLWLSPDLRDRVAAALGYLLDQLTNPAKRTAFRVADAASIGFRPRELLLELCTAYTHLGDADEREGGGSAAAASGGGGGGSVAASTAAVSLPRFPASVAADSRSFSGANWAEAAAILDRAASSQPAFLETHPHLPAVLEGWRALQARVAAAAAVLAQSEADLGELPDEVSDSVTAELLSDPVRLPTSGTVLDRATIVRVLIDEERDPFNRKHLTADMLEPLPALAVAVAVWVSARKRRDAEAEAAALAGVRRLRDEAEAQPAAAVASASPAAAAPDTDAIATGASGGVSMMHDAGDAAGDEAAESADAREEREELERALALSMAMAEDDGPPPAAAAAAAAVATFARGGGGGDDAMSVDSVCSARSASLSQGHDTAAGHGAAAAGCSGGGDLRRGLLMSMDAEAEAGSGAPALLPPPPVVEGTTTSSGAVASGAPPAGLEGEGEDDLAAAIRMSMH